MGKPVQLIHFLDDWLSDCLLNFVGFSKVRELMISWLFSLFEYQPRLWFSSWQNWGICVKMACNFEELVLKFVLLTWLFSRITLNDLTFLKIEFKKFFECPKGYFEFLNVT
jgi:hypothetical protein